MTTENQVASDAATQINAPEVAETPEVATPEAVETTEQADAKPAESEADKALRSMQRRINRQTAVTYRERAEKEQLARELAELRSKLQPAEDEPRLVDEREVMTRAERLAEEIASQKTLLKEIDAKSNNVVREGRKAFKDFDDAVVNLTAEVGPLFTQRGLPTPICEAILDAENPAKLMHYLGSNPDVAAELADLTPIKAAKRIDRIERDLSAAPKQSAAPKPLTPVRAAASSDGLSSDLPTDEWMKRREKQLRERSGY